MSSLVSQYTEHVAMRVEGAVTASGTFVHSFLASFVSLHSLTFKTLRSPEERRPARLCYVQNVFVKQIVYGNYDISLQRHNIAFTRNIFFRNGKRLGLYLGT